MRDVLACVGTDVHEPAFVPFHGVSERGFTVLMELSPHQGFGFNGDLLETNILNLSVVVGIVVTFGGDALRSLLDNRRKLIESTLQQAEERSKHARERLERAQNDLALAKERANEIRVQGTVAAKREQEGLIEQTEQDIGRLKQLKEEAIGLQQQRVVTEVSQQVVCLALSQARERLATRFDSTLHQSINSFNIVLFNNYKPS